MANIPDSPNPKAWLDFADEDFSFASTGLGDPQTHFFPQICFFFQQAAEKYLKAYIIASKLEFKKIHELPTLLQICAKDDFSFNNLQEECNFLTEFYFEARYPVHLPPSNITRKMAEKAKESAKKIGDFVKEKLSSKI